MPKKKEIKKIPKKITKKIVKKKEEKALIVKDNLSDNINVNPQSLIQQALKEKVSMDVLERLFTLRQTLQEEQARIAFREAMSQFQSSIPIIARKKKVYNQDKQTKKKTTLRYTYAPLEDIVEQVQPYLEKCGLSYDIEINIIDGGVEAIVSVYHILGHSKQSKFCVPVDAEAYMNVQQKWASTQTFAKRYAFCNAFGILTMDEDTDTNDITIPEEKDKGPAVEEMKKRIDALSDEVQTGLRILGYGVKMAYLFSEKFGWDERKILFEIKKIVDMKSNT